MLTTVTRKLRNAILSIPMEEASVERRGFHVPSPAMRSRIESIGHMVVAGYNLAVDEDRPGPLGERLAAIEPEYRGFAFEGAGMALALLDLLRPWRARRIPEFLAGPAAPHIYMVYVGIGWAMARLPIFLYRELAGLDPVLGWLVLDGFGFHQGFFHPGQVLSGQPVPNRIHGYGRRAFDQGLGRSLWFVEGGDLGGILRAIGRFSKERHGDLWSGLGLACCYAGGVDRSALETLLGHAERYHPQFRQGVAFAAKARVLAGNSSEYTEMACQVLTGRSAEEAARVTDDSRSVESGDDRVPTYEIWRCRIQDRIAQPT